LVLAGDLRGAADRFAAMGNATFEARQRLHAGERLLASGQRAAGEIELQRALAFYGEVGATFFVERAEKLLTAAGLSSSARMVVNCHGKSTLCGRESVSGAGR